MPLLLVIRLLLVSAMIGTTATGCTSIATDHLTLGGGVLAPRPERTLVEILTEPPSLPYTKIAMVEVVARKRWITWDDLREALIEEARKVGADAVMDLAMGGEPFGAIVGSGTRGNLGLVGSSGIRKKLTGVAIRYK